MAEQDILLTFLRRRSLESARRLAAREGVFFPEDLAAQVARVEACSVAELPGVLRALAVDCERAQLFLFRYQSFGREGRRPGFGLGVAARALAEQFGDPVLDRFSQVLCARDHIAEQRFVEAAASLESLLESLSAPQSTAEVVVECQARYWLGWARLWCGDFRRAQRLLDQAVALATRHDLACRWLMELAYGGFLVEAGQFREALKILSSEELRRGVREQDDFETLAYSHLVAADAGLRLEATAKANHELCELQELIDAHPEQLGDYRGHLVMMSAKLDARWGNHAEAIHLLEHATELFEALDPPNYGAVLDAKLELTKFAARSGRYDIVFTRVGELLEEAERRGCMNARTRLLSFQSRLFMDERAPAEKLREAYTDLVTRVHLINNPRLTFMAYADLYSFARKRFDRREQKFWLDRLRGLRSVLERSCYEDLYDAYVLERYREEIEGGLASLDRDLTLPTDD